jgi:radical SAM superfamily enzyme YgiQ (UPF0313 family)
MPEEILEYMGGDCRGVVGPGETALAQLITDLMDNNATQKIYRATTANFGQLQNVELLGTYRYLFPGVLNTVGVRTVDGCGQNCNYCSYPVISGNRITPRSIPGVLGDIRTLMGVGITSFMFADDIFNASLEHAKAILRTLLDTGDLPKSWYAYLNIRNIDEEFLELILDTNGYSHYSGGQRDVNFAFDIDSGCERILASIGKSFTTEDIKRTMALFETVRKRHVGHRQIVSIKTEFHMLLGHPGEDEDSIRESCQLLSDMAPDMLSFQIGVRVYPHTALARETKGVLWSKPEDLLEPVFIPHSRGKIENWLFKYLRPKYHIRQEYDSVDNTMRMPFITAVLEGKDNALSSV